tara:strand:- start:237 stop:443 length:207 start_codon:yes stop_codon:yes gene_type:complete
MSKEYKVNDRVRIIKYPKNDINGYARINFIFPDGRVWLTNINMPYQGTISEIFTKEEFEELLNQNKNE